MEDIDYYAEEGEGSTLRNPIQLEVREDGKELEFRVCYVDSSRTFEYDTFIRIDDGSGGSAYRQFYNLSTAGNQCSPWEDIYMESDYEEGDQFKITWRFISPSWTDVVNDWDESCNPVAANNEAGGYCYHDDDRTMTRTCKE